MCAQVQAANFELLGEGSGNSATPAARIRMYRLDASEGGANSLQASRGEGGWGTFTAGEGYLTITSARYPTLALTLTPALTLALTLPGPNPGPNPDPNPDPNPGPIPGRCALTWS